MKIRSIKRSDGIEVKDTNFLRQVRSKMSEFREVGTYCQVSAQNLANKRFSIASNGSTVK